MCKLPMPRLSLASCPPLCPSMPLSLLLAFTRALSLLSRRRCSWRTTQSCTMVITMCTPGYAWCESVLERTNSVLNSLSRNELLLYNALKSIFRYYQDYINNALGSPTPNIPGLDGGGNISNIMLLEICLLTSFAAHGSFCRYSGPLHRAMGVWHPDKQLLDNHFNRDAIVGVVTWLMNPRTKKLLWF
ncbi:hypothetical protein BX666DRAFT_725078 [Dichotomocladium elegans]|nr:hypothetical protein BX666DRAFT_725078 [Dichotomocladium elegans]